MFFGLAIAAQAQTLARPGWTASGLTADPWWKHAVFYQIMHPVTSDLPAGSGTPAWLGETKLVSEKLDALQSLRIDALILDMPDEQNSGAELDAFDDMVSQASRRGIRVVLSVSASSPALAEKSRFWLSRGVAGIYVAGDAKAGASETIAKVQMVRTIANSAVGGRIVISDMHLASAEASAQPSSLIPRRRRSNSTGSRGTGDQGEAQLHIDSHVHLPDLPDATALRKLIAEEPQGPNVLLDLQPPAAPSATADPYAAIKKSIAAIELATHPAALIDANGALSSELGTDDAVTEWFHQLIALHHGNSTLRFATATPLDFDAQAALVWVSRAPGNTAVMAPVVVACNLSSSPLHLSLGSAVRKLGLRGSFLRTLLRTDKSMGPQDLDSVTIPPFGVYIGELRR
jgi:hypothetical protein